MDSKNLQFYRSVTLDCNCPPRCPCGSKETRKWCHKKCGLRSRVNENGDIYCNDALDPKKDCKEYFIQNAKFQCSVLQQQNGKDNTYEQYRSASEFLMAIAQVLQPARFQLTENDVVQFAANLNTQVMKRWAR